MNDGYQLAHSAFHRYLVDDDKVPVKVLRQLDAADSPQASLVEAFIRLKHDRKFKDPEAVPSGAPFASGIVVMTADLQISGTPKTYAVRAGSGRLATRSFCSDCGTPLFTHSEANAQFTSIRFPSLDNASNFKPNA